MKSHKLLEFVKEIRVKTEDHGKECEEQNSPACYGKNRYNEALLHVDSKIEEALKKRGIEYVADHRSFKTHI